MLRYLGAVLMVVFSVSCVKKPPEEISNSKPAGLPGEEQVEKELYTLPGLDHGLIQSPVNILTYNAEEVKSESFHVHYYPNSDHNMKLLNTGHSIKLEFETKSTIEYDGITYKFQQAHFHTPSEHQVDGMTFPMEMHIVNRHEATDEQDTQEYLVIGFFFKMGRENKFLKRFIEKIPKNPNEVAKLDENDPVTLEDLLDQIRYINELEGNNARHVQALYGRGVESY